MQFPKINIYLDKISHNVKILSDRCAREGISVVAVTKGVLGNTRIARTIAEAGIKTFGDSRVGSLRKLNRHFSSEQLMMIRIPMLSSIREMVSVCGTSLNTQIEVVQKINYVCSAKGKSHNIIIMVDTDDNREGLRHFEVVDFCKKAAKLKAIKIIGLGTNACCISDKEPTYRSLSLLSSLKKEAESILGKDIPVLSGGNSSLYNLIIQGKVPEGVNQVRIGEAILLGHETVKYRHIKGAYRDCFALTAEIIEMKKGPSKAIIALGLQDVDAQNIKPLEKGVDVVGQSSDHMVITLPEDSYFNVGDKISFNMDYFGLLSCMTSPFVEKNYIQSR